jgi:formylglycine-generating enzyme required for sulfatase activity
MTSNYVIRGGGWNLNSDRCRSAYRYWSSPVAWPSDLGFRVLRSSEVDNKPRVFRGGSWYDYSGLCRSACRIRHSPDLRLHRLGFRVIKENKYDE